MQKIEVTNIANWLFGFYLSSIVIVGVCIIVLGPSSSLLSLEDMSGIFAIIVPVLIGQMAIISQWIVTNSMREKENTQKVYMSKWFVYLPPIVILFLILLAFVLRIISVNGGLEFTESQFKILAGLAMSILNGTTVLIITTLFRDKKNGIETSSSD